MKNPRPRVKFRCVDTWIFKVVKCGCINIKICTESNQMIVDFNVYRIGDCQKLKASTEYPKVNKMLSYRRETALQGALQFSPKVEDWNWETIFYGHYRSIFNHCDIIGLKICRIP